MGHDPHDTHNKHHRMGLGLIAVGVGGMVAAGLMFTIGTGGGIQLAIVATMAVGGTALVWAGLMEAGREEEDH